MNKKRLFILTGILIVLALVLAAAGCSKPDENNGSADSTDEAQAMITASPDGDITASPTLQPGETETADDTERADVTEPDGSAEPGTTEGSGDATEQAGSTEPGTTQGSNATEPAGVTQSPGSSLVPIATPEATQNPGGETPRPQLTFPNTTFTSPTPTPRPSSSTSTPAPTAVPANDYEAHYAGAVIDCTGVSVGGTFYWTLDLLNEHSRMWSGQWLVDYPEQYMSVDSYSTTWSGGVTAAVNATWDDEEPWSDKPAIVCNPEYMGQTGGVPVGESGNMYANVGMYITSFQYYGLQMSGSLIRFKFQLNTMPQQSAMKHDSDGYYLEIPITVVESTATIDNPDPNINGFSCVGHGVITSEPGKMYFKH